MKILFISYHFGKTNSVGAKRLTYWANNISNYHHETEVITTTEQSDVKSFLVHIVKPKVSKNLLYNIIKEPGVNWINPLRKKLKELSNTKSFDIVLISGGPFMHMTLGKEIKQLFNCKLILDFRDPFAINPRFNNNFIKIAIKKYFEKSFIKNADKIISVNDYCLSLLSGYEKNKDKFIVIENGYDETQIPLIKKKQTKSINTNLVYAGALYDDRNPVNLIKAISNNEFKHYIFNHIGTQSNFFKKNSNSNIIEHGLKPYKATLDLINNFDIALIFTSGTPFESTTKIFDYIALNKKILIITKGEINTGNLNKITTSYPNISWAEDNIEKIQTALINLDKIACKAFDSSQFTRKKSLELLVKLIENIRS